MLQGLAFVLLAVSYHPPSFKKLHTVKTRKELIVEIDFLGIFLFIVGVTLFLLGISWGGGKYPWKSAAVICTLVIGAVTIVAFFVWGKHFLALRLLRHLTINQRHTVLQRVLSYRGLSSSEIPECSCCLL